MSQREVQIFLEKNKGEWFTAKQISEKIGITLGSCQNNIKRLRKHGIIEVREAAKRYTYEYSYLHQDPMINRKPNLPREIEEESTDLSEKDKFLKKYGKNMVDVEVMK